MVVRPVKDFFMPYGLSGPTSERPPEPFVDEGATFLIPGLLFSPLRMGVASLAPLFAEDKDKPRDHVDEDGIWIIPVNIPPGTPDEVVRWIIDGWLGGIIKKPDIAPPAFIIDQIERRRLPPEDGPRIRAPAPGEPDPDEEIPLPPKDDGDADDGRMETASIGGIEEDNSAEATNIGIAKLSTARDSDIPTFIAGAAQFILPAIASRTIVSMRTAIRAMP